MATVTVTHASLTGAAANPDVLVDGPKWDANHVVGGLENVPNVDTTNASNLTSGTIPIARFSGGPIVVLATGQSNMVQRLSYAWTPPANAYLWNWDLVDGHVGTAFAPLASVSISMSDRIAAVIAEANPTRSVYVINISFSGQTIAHWMVGAPSPDAYANILANVVPALAAIGASNIHGLFWWQGENQTSSPELYVDNFNTVMARFQGETWFPRQTPVTVYSISPSVQSGSLATDAVNAILQAVVRAEPDYRRLVYTGNLSAAHWADTLHPSGIGTYVMGEMGANAYLHGETHLPMLDPLSSKQNSGSVGRPAFRNLIRNGDMTVNPWRNGTSFSSAANGTPLIDNFTWVQSGVGIVDILKTADAPTVAQAGQFTQHCLHVDVTTADATISGVDYYGIQGTISGLDTSFLGFGQTGAKNLVIPFWVKSTVTGNYFVAVENSAQNRSYNSQYTVNVADTWEFKRVIIQGDTTGTWLYTSGVGLRVFWTIASSDTYLFGPDIWNAADVRVGSVTRANGMSSTSNNFKLALMQVEEGLYPSAFDRVPEALAIGNVAGLGSGVATWLTTPSSANLATAVTGETGSGALVFGTAPTISGATLTTSSVNGVTLGGNGQYPGEPTTGSASAGNIGEYVESEILSGAAVSLVTGTAKDVTSISLTAGDWDVWGGVGFAPNAATTQTTIIGYISTTSNTLPAAPNKGAYAQFSAALTTGTGSYFSVGMKRLSLSGTTTVYLGALANFAANTNAAYGFIGARRAR